MTSPFKFSKTERTPARPARPLSAPPPSPPPHPLPPRPPLGWPPGRRPPTRRGGRLYVNVTGFPFPLGPFFARKTVVTEVNPGRLWTFEQAQGLGFSNVSANVRMTVIKLACGGLWVHAPVAPTRECVAAVKALGAPVKYVVLPTFAYEHKVFMGPFCRAFPSAAAYVAPRLWSWPINLPAQFFGIFPAGVLDAGAKVPWGDEIEHRPFASSVGVGPYSEVAFFHRPSRTLLVTDAVVRVPLSPPQVVEEAALLDAGGPLPGVVAALSSGGPDAPPPPPPPTNPATRADLGWKRMALQILFFVPGDLARPDRSFGRLAGRLLVSPVLRKLVFGNARAEAKAWIDDICASWDFRRIIPAHFDAPIPARPADLRAAFSFLADEDLGTAPLSGAGAAQASTPLSALASLFGGGKGGGGKGGGAVIFDSADMRALDGLAGSLRSSGVLNK